MEEIIDQFNLNRFTEAQKNNYQNALMEVKSGKKIGHWIWYIFPQIYGLGQSSTSIEYSIKSELEAKEFLKNEVLGNRLLEITKTLFNLENKSAYEIFGDPDYLKVKSSMTLFDSVQNDNKLFQSVLLKYYNGEACKRTQVFLKTKS